MRAFFHNLTHLDITDAGVRPYRFAPAVLPFYAQLGDWYGNCSVCDSGIFIEFETENSTFEFDFNVPVKILGAGFDVWENDRAAAFIPIKGSGHFAYSRRSAGRGTVRIYLPDSAALTLRNLDFSGCSPVPDGDGPGIAFLGDSITQCAYFPRSSQAFCAVIQRKLHGKMLNLGVGSMKYEPDSLFELPFTPEFLCVSYGCNDLYQAPTEELSREYEKAIRFLNRLREMYPHAKRFANTPLRHPFCQSDPFFDRKFRLYRAEAEKFIPAAGFTLIDGLSLVPEGAQYFAADGIHLSIEGSRLYAERLLDIIQNT